MNAFEEFMFDDKYVLRFYRGDHGLICTINESMVSELREVESRLRQQQNEIEFLKKEILEKHEDWKHEGQQAANARAEIEALKEEIKIQKTCSRILMNQIEELLK